MTRIYNKCLIKRQKKGQNGLTEGKAECGWLSTLPPERPFLCHPAGCYKPCETSAENTVMWRTEIGWYAEFSLRLWEKMLKSIPMIDFGAVFVKCKILGTVCHICPTLTHFYICFYDWPSTNLKIWGWRRRINICRINICSLSTRNSDTILSV